MQAPEDHRTTCSIWYIDILLTAFTTTTVITSTSFLNYHFHSLDAQSPILCVELFEVLVEVSRGP